MKNGLNCLVINLVNVLFNILEFRYNNIIYINMNVYNINIILIICCLFGNNNKIWLNNEYILYDIDLNLYI